MKAKFLFIIALFGILAGVMVWNSSLRLHTTKTKIGGDTKKADQIGGSVSPQSFSTSVSIIPSSHSETLYGEVMQILQTRYADPSALATKKADQAAVDGVLNSLEGSVRILDHEAIVSNKASSLKDTINSVTVLEPFIGYLRLNQIENDTSKRLEDEIQKLLNEKHVTGLILDLRFAQGTNYAAVPTIASLFFRDARPLFSIQRGSTIKTYRSIPSSYPTNIPLLLLVNQETKEAPELLAAVLRDQERALLVGNSNAAGQIFETSDVQLSDGRILRIATNKIFLAHGGDFFLKKIQPDLLVPFDKKIEKETFGHPFQPPKLQVGTHFYSEAILMGHQTAPSLVAEKEKKELPEPPSNSDLVLLRAVDLLKGIQALGLDSSEKVGSDNKS